MVGALVADGIELGAAVAVGVDESPRVVPTKLAPGGGVYRSSIDGAFV